MFAQRSAATETLRAAIQESGARMVEVSAGDELPGYEQIQPAVLHPTGISEASGDNAQSIVLLIRHQGRRLLLTGDLEARGLSRLLSRPPIDCDVLLAPHHGSPHSDPAACARWSKPELVVISGDNAQDHPHVAAIYQRHGATVLHTANAGAVSVLIDQRGASATSWQQRAASFR
jgi:competence protein ComEC